jgi:subtilisin family serine protease
MRIPDAVRSTSSQPSRAESEATSDAVKPAVGDQFTQPGESPPLALAQASVAEHHGGGVTRVPVPGIDLSRGMEHAERYVDAIQRLQVCLRELGYLTQEQLDSGFGIFGPQTEAALQKLQIDHGIAGADGKYDRATTEKLIELLAIKPLSMDDALEKVLGDEKVDANEWATILHPAALNMVHGASEDARKLVRVFADSSIALEGDVQYVLPEVLLSRGYDVSAWKWERPTGDAAKLSAELIQSNVAERDEAFATIASRAGRSGAEVTVAVLDAGFDTTHPAFEGKLWSNPNEKADGIDNDGNGITDDLHGADFFLEGDNNPNGEFDDRGVFENGGHATHVTGIATRGTDQVNAMALRVYEGDELTGQDVAESIDYAVTNGARVLNMSFKVTGAEDVALVIAAMQRHPEVLFVKSAGNDGENLSSYDALAYLAKNSLPNLVVCSAATRDGERVDNSNYGTPWSTHAAVGEVLSTMPGQDFAEDAGTSMAAPNITNVAARMLVMDPALSPEQVMQMLTETTRASAEWKALTNAGGLIEGQWAYSLAGLTGLMREGKTADQAADQLELSGDLRAKLVALAAQYV